MSKKQYTFSGRPQFDGLRVREIRLLVGLAGGRSYGLELVDTCNVHPQAAYTALKRLLRLGLVVRSPELPGEEPHKRAPRIYYELSRDGRKMIDEWRDALNDVS